MIEEREREREPLAHNNINLTVRARVRCIDRRRILTKRTYTCSCTCAAINYLLIVTCTHMDGPAVRSARLPKTVCLISNGYETVRRARKEDQR